VLCYVYNHGSAAVDFTLTAGLVFNLTQNAVEQQAAVDLHDRWARGAASLPALIGSAAHMLVAHGGPSACPSSRPRLEGPLPCCLA
jgi:hypothetical protein